MTPTEKSEELINNLYEINCKFIKADTYEERADRYKLLIPLCKANALYAVDEIIQEIKEINRVAFDNKDVFIQLNIKYWQEVKAEIEKAHQH